ncbi:TadE/TadG family type IV pilus assembly protein [Cellulomonas sp. SLBN-39]|uniref:TadE/TadG family type IV pilus assembly protein n=1 Tax=Cellulomonas sp. SLBN-39 TaxID=2768446 RepID=UPI002103B149|nr:TadE/TadG family type IV pilus assembly protein [Cellulomonas sp. SLBN-39]
MTRPHVRRRDDRGASSIEMVLYTPLLMLVIFVIVQLALSWYGNELAGAVARETARVVRTGGGTPESVQEARAHALDYADRIGGASLTDLSVEITRPDDLTVRVVVTGRAVEIVQGLAPRVEATVQGPVEGFRPDS